MIPQVIDRLKREAFQASEKMEELLVKVQQRFPKASISNASNTKRIIVNFDVEGLLLNATIMRHDISTSMFNRSFAIRVSVNGIWCLDSSKTFSKKFSGTRLKTDILSDKFNEEKIFKALMQVQQFAIEESARRKAAGEYKEKVENQREDICKYMTENTNQAFKNEYGLMGSKGTTIKLNTSDRYTLELSYLSKEEMSAVVNFLDHFRKNP